VSEETNTRQRAPKLIGARELMLIEELAVADHSHAELAERLGVAEKTVDNFASRNRDRIAAAARDQTDKLAGLWIARKELRIAEYQSMYERDRKMIEDMEETAEAFAESADLPGLGPDVDKVVKLHGDMRSILSTVADETGQLSPRMPERPQRGHIHIIRGV
jgi:hypothetical protein